MSHLFLLPFPTLLLAASLFSLPSPVVKDHAGKMKPNRGEKWNIDFLLLFFFFVFTQLLMAFSGLSFFTHHPLFSSPRHVSSCLSSPHTIVSPSAVLFFYEVSEGRGYSSRRIKCAKIERVSLFVLCVFQNHAPADLYLMTKNPEDSPNTPDVLEIEFKNGLCL